MLYKLPASVIENPYNLVVCFDPPEFLLPQDHVVLEKHRAAHIAKTPSSQQ
jgi:hypothetical protein